MQTCTRKALSYPASQISGHYVILKNITHTYYRHYSWSLTFSAPIPEAVSWHLLTQRTHIQKMLCDVCPLARATRRVHVNNIIIFCARKLFSCSKHFAHFVLRYVLHLHQAFRSLHDKHSRPDIIQNGFCKYSFFFFFSTHQQSRAQAHTYK